MSKTHNDIDEILPDLDPDDLDDEQDLAEVVDEAILALSHSAPELLRLGDEILAQQEALRDAFPEAWTQHLAVDELVTARTAELVVELVRWAFNEGARHGRRPGEES